MPGDIPKQFRMLSGKPVLWHTLSRLQEVERISRIIVIGHVSDARLHDEVIAHGGLSKVDGMVSGGAQRRESVLAGLRLTDATEEIILVHDGVRPCFSRALADRVIDAAVKGGAAIAAIGATDTVKIAKDGVIIETPDRDSVWQAQTPQAFRRDLLVRAFEMAPSVKATDESTLVEAMGHPVQLVEGELENVKITTEQDLHQIESQFARRAGVSGVGRVGGNLRVGQGYDVHRLVEGRKLILAGLEIPHPKGLLGHSDADVLTHSVIDALLGAAGMGDIGRLFPDTDAAYKDISSLLLLDQVRARLEASGARIINIDAVVIAQSPKLQPYISAMERALASHLAIQVDSISIKATTTEGLGFVGREEGIAAQAVASIVL
jgi:2-C-methyl-D-erythritol 2,4-cyclodiphosphate synthase/2-C-methyl-D-erythritol 4-phosphate cytidylyltransferase